MGGQRGDGKGVSTGPRELWVTKREKERLNTWNLETMKILQIICFPTV